jgi:hypothetical protein
MVIQERTTIKHGNVAETKPAGPAVPPAPVPVPQPIEHARSVPDPVVSPAPEKITRETVLQKIIDRIYATEPAPLPTAEQIAKPLASVEPDRSVQPRLVEVRQPEPPRPAAQPRVELHERIAGAIEVAPSEKRTVNVRIGALELKLLPPAAPTPAAPVPPSVFEGFDEIRSYRF